MNTVEIIKARLNNLRNQYLDLQNFGLEDDFGGPVQAEIKKLEAYTTMFQVKDIKELFTSENFRDYMQKFWPAFVGVANNMCLCNGKLMQEVGRLREKALIYLLYRYLGEDIHQCPVDSFTVGVHEPEKDVEIFGKDVSIKTLTTKGNQLSPPKITWCDDTDLAQAFIDNFKPTCDLLVACIQWEATQGIYYIDCDVQAEVLGSVNEDQKFILAKGYTKGTRLHPVAWKAMLAHPNTLMVPIKWPKEHRNESILDQFWDTQYLRIDKEGNENANSN